MKTTSTIEWTPAGSNDDLLKEHDITTTEDMQAKPRRPHQGKMRGQLWELLLASSLLILPMLGLSITLAGLVYTRLVPDNDSTYSDDDHSNIPIGSSAYYISYPAMRLVFIASVSSTLATVLISPAMVVFSYLVAHYIAASSDAREVHKLPSPYQLVLLIRMLDARIMAIWSFVCYSLNSKGKTVRVMPELWRAAAMMSSLAFLALLINFADTWLHLTTTSVQYTSLRRWDADFGPGRGLPETCLNLMTKVSTSNSTNAWANCSVSPARGTTPGGLIDQTEFVQTINNLSAKNQIYSVGGQAILANPPVTSQGYAGLDLDFEATSFAASSFCQMMTDLCGVDVNSSNATGAAQTTPFACNVTEADLDVSGSFSDIRSHHSTINDSFSLSLNNTFGLSGGSEGTLKSDSIGFQYFDNAEKTQRSLQLGPTNYSSPSLWWAFIFTLDTGWESNQPEAQLGPNQLMEESSIASFKDGGYGGIMSCNTNLSQVTYASKNGSLSILELKPLNGTAAVAFVSAMSQGYGYEQLQEGIERAAAIETSSTRIADAFASTYDRIMVALPAGALLHRRANTAHGTKHTDTWVTRLPKAPFLALLVLDLLYACIGIGLMMTALSALFFGERVRDAQARLSIAAVVAESFESPALGEDATTIDDLFAERRGLKTRRVGITRMGSGGRHYQQMVGRGTAEICE